MDFSKLADEFLDILNHLKLTLFEFLPKLLGAIFIFLVGLLIARLVRVFITRFVNTLHCLFPNQKVRLKIRNFIEEKPITKVIGSIIYWLLIFFFLTIATETLGLPVVTTWLSGIVGYLPKILSATLICIAGIIGGIVLRDLIITAADSAAIVYGNILAKTVQVVVLLVSILISIDLIGIDVTLLHNVFIITIGALLFGAALAFGLGAQISVGNILASYYLQKVYKVGDIVRVKEKEGRIIAITPLAVILDAPDGQTCIPARQFNEGSSVLLNREN